MEHLLELGAEIEQDSLLTPFHTEIALIALESMRNMLLHSPQPATIVADVPQNIPIAAPEEIPSNEEDESDIDKNPIIETISDLNPIQRAQVSYIPFLHHK